MDTERFDLFARSVSACTSRRQALRLLAGVAVAGLRPRGVAAWTCGPGLTDCFNAGCVDLSSDLNNCGACGAVCESGLVGVRCRHGVCERADCPPNLTFCGAVDLCRDLSSDPGHCGACGNACASGVCEGGVCAGGAGCAVGQAECGGVCVDTCCDNANCGACGNACPAGQSCFEGVCGCPSGLCCAEGEVNCNGVCVATCCDNQNCGACGNVCGAGRTCFEGVCDCPSGRCGTIQLPNTGSGAAGSGRDESRWAPLAVLGAGAALLAGRMKRGASRTSGVAALQRDE